MNNSLASNCCHTCVFHYQDYLTECLKSLKKCSPKFSKRNAKAHSFSSSLDNATLNWWSVSTTCFPWLDLIFVLDCLSIANSPSFSNKDGLVEFPFNLFRRVCIERLQILFPPFAMSFLLFSENMLCTGFGLVWQISCRCEAQDLHELNAPTSLLIGCHKHHRWHQSLTTDRFGHKLWFFMTTKLHVLSQWLPPKNVVKWSFKLQSRTFPSQKVLTL